MSKERREVVERLEELEAIRQGKPFSTCLGDCGEPLYCCGGEWDYKNRIEKLERELDAARAEVGALRSAFKIWKNATESRCRLLSSRESSDTMLDPDRALIAAFSDAAEGQGQ